MALMGKHDEVRLLYITLIPLVQSFPYSVYLYYSMTLPYNQYFRLLKGTTELQHCPPTF